MREHGWGQLGGTSGIQNVTRRSAETSRARFTRGQQLLHCSDLPQVSSESDSED